MRKGFFLVVALVACSKAETPATDTAAAAPPPPPAPAALTAADLRGTWNGTSKREGDTTTGAWAIVSTDDSTGKFIFANSKDSVATMSKFDGDSVIVTSASYKDPNLPKNAPPVTFRSVGHLKDGKLSGVATIMLASKPDSVVGRATWEATKAP